MMLSVVTKTPDRKDGDYVLNCGVGYCLVLFFKMVLFQSPFARHTRLTLPDHQLQGDTVAPSTVHLQVNTFRFLL